MRKTTKLAAALVILGLAAAPFSDTLKFDAERNHLAKKGFVRSLAAPSERLSDVACDEATGMAEMFPCANIDLLSFIPDDEMINVGAAPLGGGLSDIWGWTSPETGDEYVFFGKTNGTAFYRITDPTAPEYLGEVPNPGPAELIWHDIKVRQRLRLHRLRDPGPRRPGRRPEPPRQPARRHPRRSASSRRCPTTPSTGWPTTS